jgi:hypothetical protein
MAEYYVYQPNQQHAGPMTADEVARGVVTRKIPEGAQFAAVGDTAWGPLEGFAELADAVKALNAAPAPPRPRMQTLAPGIPGPTSIPPMPPRRTNTPSGVVIPQSPAVPAFPIPPMPVEASVIVKNEARAAPGDQRGSRPNIELSAPTPLPVAGPAAVPASVPASVPPAGPTACPAPEVAEPKKEEKKDDKPKAPALDPKYKNLPLVIFGGFAIIALFEIVIAAATSSSPKHDPTETVGTVGKAP